MNTFFYVKNDYFKKIVFLFIYTSSFLSYGQLSENHWLPPLHAIETSGGTGYHAIYLSTPEPTPFAVTVTTGDGTSIAGSPFTISQNNPITVQIGASQPSVMFLNEADVGIVNDDKGLKLSASSKFYVSFKVKTLNNNQAELIVSKGEFGLGTVFRAGSVPNNNGSSSIISSNFVTSFMASEDNTTVTVSDYDANVVFISGTTTVSGNSSQTFTLNEGESVILSGKSSDSTFNLAGFIGALITSDKPIIVNTGNILGGTVNGKQDYCFDQIVPFNLVGNEYVLVRGNGNANTETPIIVAHLNNTDIYINGSATPITTLNAGDYYLIPESNYQGTNNENMYITASNNIFVYQLLAGSINEATVGLNFIPPLSCFFSKSIDLMPAIHEIGSSTYTSDILAVTQTGAVVSVNGITTTASSEPVLGTSDWVSYRISGYTGDVKIESTLPIVAGIFGASGVAGYAGFYSGFANKVSNTNVTICPGSTVDLFLEINGIPIPGGTWTPPLNSGGNIFDANVDLPVTYNYYANSGGACTDTDVDVTVNFHPSITSPTSTGDITVCEDGASQSLDASSQITGANITWYDTSTGGSIITSPTLTSTTAATVTYYASATSPTTFCESLTRTPVTLTIQAAPTAPTSTGDITVCEDGASQSLDANSQITGTNITWYDVPTGGSIITNPTLTSTTANTVTYYASATSPTTSCESLTRTPVTLTIQAAPTAPTSTGDITVCEDGASQSLDASSQITGTNITWYDAPTGGSIITSPTLTSTTAATVTYYASTTNTNTCESLTRTPVTLTIQAAPTAPTSTGDITVCEDGTSQTLDASSQITGTNITWYDAPTGGSIITNPTLTSTTAATVTYYASTTNTNTCESLTRTPVTLTIQAASTSPTSTGDITVCEDGTSQTLDASSQITGTNITWYDVPTGGSIITNPTLTSTTAATVTYYASTTNTNTCESLTRTPVTLTIQAAPTAPTSTGDITVCEDGASQTLDASSQITGTNITWYDAPTGGSIITNPTLTSTTAATVTYYASTTNTNTCESLTRTPVTLTIQAAPTAPTSTGDITVCEDGASQSLDANSQITGANITWYDAPTGGSIITSPTLTSTTAATVTYYASATSPTTSCESLTRAPVTLTIQAAPTSPTSTGDITVCEDGTSQSLDVSSQITGTNITWYDAPTGGSIITSPTLTSTTAATVTYYASTTSPTTFCESLTRTPVTLTIQAAPTAPTSTGDITVCEDGTSQTLDASSQITGTNITWYDAPTGGSIITSPTLTSTTANTVTYYASTTNTNNCESLTRTPVTLTIETAPAAPTSAGDITVCEDGTSQTLDASSQITGANITWYDAPTGGSIITSPTLTSTTANTVTYYASTTNTNNCESLTRTPVTLTIQAAPTAPTSTGDITVCEDGASQTLDASSQITGTNITWYDAPTGGSIITNPTLTSTTAATVTYYASTTNTNTCESLTRTPVTLTIQAAPTAPTSTGDITVCEDGASQSLDANSQITGANITWYDAPTGGSIITSPTLTSTTAATVTYYASATSPTTSCESLTRAPVTLTIQAAPTSPTSTGDITVCEDGTSQSLDVSSQITGTNITWYDAPTGGSIITSPTLTSTTAATVTYYASTTSPTTFCESLTRTPVTLTIQAAPTAPTSTGDITVCEDGTSQTLDASSQITGTNITWYDAPTGGSIITSPTLTSTTANTVTYYASTTNTNNCESLTRTPVTLTIETAPAAPTSAGDITVCEDGTSQTLDASSQITGANITWYDAPTGGSIITSPTLTSTTANTVTYYASTTNTNNCESLTRTPVTLTIQAAPTSPTSAGDITVCEDGTLQTLDASSQITGTNITWYDAPTGGSIITSPTLTSTTAATVTYYASTTSPTTFCESLTRTPVTLTIQAAPTAPTSTGDITVCEDGASQSLDANSQITGTNITWYDAPTGGSIIISPTLTSTTANTVTYYASATSPTTSCESLTRTPVTLTIQAAPTAPTSTGDITVCEDGTSQTLDASSQITGTNITWYDAPTGGSIITNPTLTSTTAATVTYYASTTNTNTCESLTRTPVTLTIQAASTSPTSTGDITVCEDGTSQTLDASSQITGTNITWYDVPTGGSIITNPTLTSTTAATVTYYASTTNTNTCESLTRTPVTLTIQAAPTAPTSTGDITVCEDGASQTLDASSQITGTNITWYDAPTGGSIITNPTLTSTTAATVTYYASTTNTNTCESLTRTPVTLTIQAAPTAPTSTGDITVCEDGASQSLDANSQITGANITWYDAPTGGSIITSPTLTSTTAATVTYYASATSPTTSCESLTRAPVTLTIQAAPTSPTSTGDITVCEDGTLQTLDANSQITGTNITWYDAPTGGSIITSPTLTSTTAATVTYYASTTSPTTFCESLTRTPVTLTIQAAPTAPTSTGDITVCEDGTSQTLDASSQITGTNITWYDAPTGGSIITSPTLTSTTANTVTYYASTTNTNNCESLTRTPVTLTIETAPAAPTSAGDITVCEDGTSQTLDASSQITGANITWYDAPTGGSIIISPTLTSTTANTVTYYASTTNTNNCESLTRTPVSLTIAPLPDAYLGPEDIICVDSITGIGSYELFAGNQLTGDTYTYLWTPTNTNLDTSGNESDTYFANTSGTYSVTVINNRTRCENTDSITLQASSPPANLFANLLTSDFEEFGVIEAVVEGGFGVYEYSIDNGVTWQSNPSFDNLPGGDYQILARDIEECGIIVSNTICIFNYPKYFTPNNDGYNDTWNINNTDCFSNAKIFIFDRYGKLLKQINPLGLGWDGTYNGNNLPTDDYWFLVEYVNKDLKPKIFKSHFTLKR